MRVASSRLRFLYGYFLLQCTSSSFWRLAPLHLQYLIPHLLFILQAASIDFLRRSFETDELLGHSHAWLDEDNYNNSDFDRDIAALEYTWSQVRDKLSSLARWGSSSHCDLYIWLIFKCHISTITAYNQTGYGLGVGVYIKAISFCSVPLNCCIGVDWMVYLCLLR